MTGSTEQAPTLYPPRRAVAAWVMFDWSAQPFFTLVTTFVFAPFFAAAVASSPEQRALRGFASHFFHPRSVQLQTKRALENHG
jgi:MFS transporter, UMF1 family